MLLISLKVSLGEVISNLCNCRRQHRRKASSLLPTQHNAGLACAALQTSP